MNAAARSEIPRETKQFKGPRDDARVDPALDEFCSTEAPLSDKPVRPYVPEERAFETLDLVGGAGI
jgi:hypothetical protein